MGAPVLTFGTSGVRLSAVGGHNHITVDFTSDIDYQAFECRATKHGEDFGVGRGQLVAAFSHTPAGVQRTFDIFDSYLIEGEGEYRISLFAQSTDGAWNDTQWFAPNGSACMKDADGKLFFSGR